ncbi:MAG: glycosyltransferase family protein [Myxococcales bacterium]|nr:glycosyltransferase family protein [Myxococcales bacterium]
MKLLVVVQARTSSTRLPNKVLMPLAGRPLLARMLERVRAASTPFDLCVATTMEAADDPVNALAEQAGVRCVRGHPTDLLDRHVQAARLVDADAVAKIPSDCPLIDPAVIDRVLGAFLEDPSFDYVSNLHPATWPDGYDVEVMRRDALETAHAEARRPHEREHTTPFLWDRPGRFGTKNVAWDRDLQMTHRLTIDYAEDYELIRAVYDALHREGQPPFGLDAILQYLHAHPEVFRLNQRYAGVNWYRHHMGELQTVDASRTRWPS